MQCWHLTYAARGRVALFPDESLRRQAVRTLARVAGGELLLFCIVDEHIHLVVRADQDRLGHLARTVLVSLRVLAATQLEPAHRRAVEDRRHLERLTHYLLIQPAKHDIGFHPALWSGSCFADMVGARYVPGLELRVRDTGPRPLEGSYPRNLPPKGNAKSGGAEPARMGRTEQPPNEDANTGHAGVSPTRQIKTSRLGDVLPRFHQGTVLSHVGLPDALNWVGTERLRRAGVARIATAAAATFAADPRLSGRSAATVRARLATAQLARMAGLPASEVRWALGLTRQAVTRLLGRPLSPELLAAVDLRLALEEMVASSPDAHLPVGTQLGR